eukprot:353650-Chlamydomonas_euryale.AAC.3
MAVGAARQAGPLRAGVSLRSVPHFHSPYIRLTVLPLSLSLCAWRGKGVCGMCFAPPNESVRCVLRRMEVWGASAARNASVRRSCVATNELAEQR